ncbi:MAG: hypothetical protein JXM70_29685 [Pirellulales bacterium]|nr:hypothetical protein [Pirellulales bacterium]
MAKLQSKLKLGKSSAFGKRRLLWLPQKNLVQNADFYPLPETVSGNRSLWFGMVVSHHNGSLQSQEILEHAPTVNDLAKLLADAMRSPLTDEDRCRPKAIHFRDNPEWDELFPHLEQLGIQIVITESLRAWDEVADDFITYLEHWRSTHRPESYRDFAEELLELRLTAILFPPKQRSRIS